MPDVHGKARARVQNGGIRTSASITDGFASLNYLNQAIGTIVNDPRNVTQLD